MRKKETIRELFIGLDEEVEFEGGQKVAVNFDNAATTPAFVAVFGEIERQMPLYGSIGRGTGQKSQHSSEVYMAGRDIVLDFVDADKDQYSVVYTNCTTDGMNKLASALVESHRDLILCTRMEHHANDLPWRERARTVYVETDQDGRLNLNDFAYMLEKYPDIKYVTVTAASNVTGYLNDVHAIAALAHQYGAKIIVDGAQIVAHRAFSMKGNTPNEDIDFFVFSAHKMYAPFGGGAIVGLTDSLNAHLPIFYGGGMVEKVTDDDVIYAEAPDRYEAGSPNYPGVVGMLKAMQLLKHEIGFDFIQQHEERLLHYALKQLNHKVILYGDNDRIQDRVGILAFNLRRFQPIDVANYLARHAAIAVRHGKFCAHPYVNRLLHEEECNHKNISCVVHDGMVRISFGLYNTTKDIDELVCAIDDMLCDEFVLPALALNHKHKLFPNDRA